MRSDQELGALTQGTLEELARHPELSAAIRDIMRETEAVAARLGIELPVSIDQRLAKPSAEWRTT